MRTRLAGASSGDLRVGEYERRLGFGLDDFQRRAMEALGAGRSVLVAAPTGAGKTLVAEYGIDLARANGLRAVYTTPLKALSNQKFADLGALHGAEAVGLLTGDHSIRPWAPVLVMTTEVLRNMLYADSGAVDDVGVVVLDEVHYLQDRYRGGVWEEVIIHLPPQVALVALSATVSNAEEFGGWVETLRGDTEVVIEERRPVPLEQLYCVGVRDEVKLMALFESGGDAGGPVVNPAITRLERARSPKAWRGGPLRTPRRSEVIATLDIEGMLPAIYFIFSRRGCDRAVAQLQVDGTRLTTSEERAAIRTMADAHVASLDDDDLEALGYQRFRAGLEAGLAAHHAGMVPAFRETVEALFLEGLVKVVFATETLSLGVNMPARTVVIEKLTKFGGERHEPLTAGQYTQLTGRAGRRGIDASGNAVVLWSPFQHPSQVAELASTRTYELQSSFRPTYNMAANLVARFDHETAHRIVNSSFAQYRVDKQVVRLEASAARRRRAAQEYWERARCDRGDIAEYAELVEGGSRDEGARRSGRRRPGRPGDVAELRGRPVVVMRTVGADRKRLQVVGHDRKPRIVTRRQLGPLLARVELPDVGRSSGGAVAGAVAALAGYEASAKATQPAPSEAAGNADVDRHRCHSCPDVEAHLRWARRARRDAADAARMEARVQRRTESLGRRFDAVCRFLEELGHLDGWALTQKGELLARLYAECDLVLAEAIWAGHLRGLNAAEYASAVSVFTFEARIEGPAEPPPSVRRVREAVAASLALSAELRDREEQRGLEQTRELDDGFCGQAWAWASGRPLESVLVDDLAGGDFVRNVKQVVDLSKQVHEATEATGCHVEVGAAAAEAARRMWRGVVAVTGVIET